jgi:hypothetical protein
MFMRFGGTVRRAKVFKIIARDRPDHQHARLGVVCDNGQNSMLSKNVHFALPFFGDENPARRIASGVRICVRQISAFWISCLSRPCP